MYVLGLNVKELSLNWSASMKARYENSDTNRDSLTSKSILKRSRPNIIYTQLHTSPDGRYSTFIANDLGKYKIRLYNHDKGKSKKILKSGYRSFTQETDISFPVLAWHPTGQLIGIIRERKGKLWLGTYTLETKKYDEAPLFNFEKVLDFSYSTDGQSIVLSAIQKGQTDIFVYNLRTRTYEQITKDLFDDINPRFIDDSRAIVFASNRDYDSLNTNYKTSVIMPETYNIFYYDYRGKSSVLRRITDTPDFNETQPMQYDSANISYLSDENGIINRYVAQLDSALSYVDTVEHYRMIVKNYVLTDYPRNILSQDVNKSQNRVSEIIYRNGKYHLYVNRIDTEKRLSDNNLPKTLFRNEEIKRIDNIKETTPVTENDKTQDSQPIEQQVPLVNPDSVDIDNYIFQSDFPKSKSRKERKKEKMAEQYAVRGDSTQASTDSSGYKLPKQRNYETAFTSNYFVAQLDNSLLNQSYQLFTGGGAIYFNPGLNGFFKLGISDLLENYRITGGFKLAGDLNSNEYFLSYENLRYRLDKKLTFYRQALLLPQFGAKQHSHELRFTSSWPFSDISSIRGSIAYRNDRFVALSIDYPSLFFPNQFLNWGSARLEYVLDNTLNVGVNLFNGTRWKVFGEYYKQMDEKKTGMIIIGTDLRHYQKIHREIIWANRFASGTSFGEERLIYYMGATDNWISPKFNNETPIDFTQNYYFQALATNMRGFDQNIRNGNTFALINSEVRIPVFKYLLNRPIKSDFIRNFQIIGFGDIGTAWNGTSPYDSTNALNRKIYIQQPFVVTIISQNEPIVGGFGFGLRSRLLGYFIRADWAWGVQNREMQPYKFYFSLGLDF
jgi:Tol biopolymer transport system component